MNTTACITRTYEVLPPRPRRENKPNQTQFFKNSGFLKSEFVSLSFSGHALPFCAFLRLIINPAIADRIQALRFGFLGFFSIVDGRVIFSHLELPFFEDFVPYLLEYIFWFLIFFSVVDGRVIFSHL